MQFAEQTTDEPVWRLGLPFLRAFLMIYDNTNQRIGLARGVDKEFQRYKRQKNLVLFVGLAAIVGICLVVTIGVWVVWCRKQKEDKPPE